ncbi:hypothetical protein [Rhodococcus artemisiae]|uniref:hypothetical protein n=1 Tax=Rhodococcus artemisiae TaxID=714159 RepID=UPI0038B4B7B0
MMHAGLLDAPFGGVGASGMGHYNGREGFLEFSHARTVFVASEQDPRRERATLIPTRRQWLPPIWAGATVVFYTVIRVFYAVIRTRLRRAP